MARRIILVFAYDIPYSNAISGSWKLPRWWERINLFKLVRFGYGLCYEWTSKM